MSWWEFLSRKEQDKAREIDNEVGVPWWGPLSHLERLRAKEMFPDENIEVDGYYTCTHCGNLMVNKIRCDKCGKNNIRND